MQNVRIKVDKVLTPSIQLSNLEISLGRIIEEEWEEKMGPTPFPTVTDLRSWDHKLLQRYKPVYLPYCDVCCLCTMGKCDLTAGKKGACGLDIWAQTSRVVLLACCIGAAAHTGHARHLVEYLIERFGRDAPIDVGSKVGVQIEAPITRLVCGIRPKKLGDLEDVLSYVEREIVQLLAATATGQEGDNIDLESKVFHAGMLDHLGLEVTDIAQISTLGYPKADPEAPLVELGMGAIDSSKPMVLVIGHNVPPAANIIDYLQDHGLMGEVEVAGICCTSHDLTRYNPKAKIIGPLSWQLRFIRSGVPDVIVVDEQCIRTDVLKEAQSVKAPVIATTAKACEGLPDLTHEDANEIVKKIFEGEVPGALILKPEKAGEVAARVAMLLAPKRMKYKVIPDVSAVIEWGKRCAQCKDTPCRRACPNDLPIPEAMDAAEKGDLSKFALLYDLCIGCGRCEHSCTNSAPIHSLIVAAAQKQIREEKFYVRSGRGAIQDVEIRRVGGPIVLGEIPGIIALVGCSNYPASGVEVAQIAEEFAKRRFIVVASGCSAMSIGMYRDEEGKTIYETFPGSFDAGGVTNVGSCVANSHIVGAAIKVASIFAKRNLRANYEEIADYIHNRVGAVGIAWGAMSQKAAAIASGCWRLGIPVIVGPHGSKYRRMLLGRSDREEDWVVYDARSGERMNAGPCPQHLFYAAETKEEAIVMAAKLVLRANDTARGRAMKLSHYIDLHKKFYGTPPDDLHLFVRSEADLPITLREEVMKILKEKGWKERPIPDPTLLPRLIRKEA